MTSRKDRELFKKSSKVRLLKPNENGELVQVATLPKSGIKHKPDELPPEEKINTKDLPKHLRHLANIKK